MVVYSTVQDLFLLTHRLAHGSCSWPTDQWTVTKLCRIVSNNVNSRRVRTRTLIARAKLKLSQLFERDGIYGIDDALQNRSCSMN